MAWSAGEQTAWIFGSSSAMKALLVQMHLKSVRPHPVEPMAARAGAWAQAGSEAWAEATAAAATTTAAEYFIFAVGRLGF
jgi:hypothetical protein